jgi:leader peptidase (prepilin peptidase)/N-methyltransferase
MAALVSVGFVLLGLSVGSFLNLCSDRLPRDQSIIKPASRCDNCDRNLKAVDLVPVFSYLFLRGRCRYCGAKIPIRLPILEFVTAAVFGLLAWHYGLSLELAIALIYASLFLLIFVIDLEQGLILNVVILPAVALAFVLSFFWVGFEVWPEVGPGFVVSSLLGGAIGFGLMMLPYWISRGGMGAGDVKLAALIGLVAGFPLVLVALLMGIIAGGLVAALLLVSRLVGRKDAIPFGPFLVVGAMASLIWGENIIDWYRSSLTALASPL